MNIAELIAECGVDKVGVQYLDRSAERLNMKGGTTHITFGTEQPLTPNGTEKFGIVVWIDRQAVKDALATGPTPRLSDELATKLRAALRFGASHSVMSSDDEQAILAALASAQPKEINP